jgi:hypothetical protein
VISAVDPFEIPIPEFFIRTMANPKIPINIMVKIVRVFSFITIWNLFGINYMTKIKQLIFYNEKDGGSSVSRNQCERTVKASNL